jgi:uncharacterized protein
MIERLRVHLRLIDRDVAPVVDRYRDHIECRAGCSDCCHQTFRVSDVEGMYLREGLAQLEASKRDDILARAQSYTPDVREPCPVLSDAGTCRLYEHRPRICRKYGIPLWHPDRPHEVSTCPKNFRGTPDVDAELILEPQAEWARDWIRLREELGLPEAVNKTIAEHLLEPAR